MLTRAECDAIRERMTAPDSAPAEAVEAVPALLETVKELRKLFHPMWLYILPPASNEPRNSCVRFEAWCEAVSKALE